MYRQHTSTPRASQPLHRVNLMSVCLLVTKSSVLQLLFCLRTLSRVWHVVLFKNNRHVTRFEIRRAASNCIQLIRYQFCSVLPYYRRKFCVNKKHAYSQSMCAERQRWKFPFTAHISLCNSRSRLSEFWAPPFHFPLSAHMLYLTESNSILNVVHLSATGPGHRNRYRTTGPQASLSFKLWPCTLCSDRPAQLQAYSSA